MTADYACGKWMSQQQTRLVLPAATATTTTTCCPPALPRRRCAPRGSGARVMRAAASTASASRCWPRRAVSRLLSSSPLPTSRRRSACARGRWRRRPARQLRRASRKLESPAPSRGGAILNDRDSTVNRCWRRCRVWLMSTAPRAAYIAVLAGLRRIAELRCAAHGGAAPAATRKVGGGQPSRTPSSPRTKRAQHASAVISPTSATSHTVSCLMRVLCSA